MTVPEMFNAIAPSLMGLAYLVSAMVWGWVIWGLSGSRLPLERGEYRNICWDSWVVFAGFATWVLTDQVVYAALQIGGETPFVERVQALCLGGMLKTLLLLEFLYASTGTRAVDLLPTRRSWLVDVRAGVWGFSFCLIPVGVVNWLTRSLREAGNGHEYIRELRDNPEIGTMIWIGVAVFVIAPLFEELLFRVVLQGWLQERMQPVVAVTIVAILFAAVHGSSWPDPLPLFPLALVFGYVYYRRRSYLANVVMHALFNGFNFLMAVISTWDA